MRLCVVLDRLVQGTGRFASRARLEGGFCCFPHVYVHRISIMSFKLSGQPAYVSPITSKVCVGAPESTTCWSPERMLFSLALPPLLTWPSFVTFVLLILSTALAFRAAVRRPVERAASHWSRCDAKSSAAAAGRTYRLEHNWEFTSSKNTSNMVCWIQTKERSVRISRFRALSCEKTDAASLPSATVSTGLIRRPCYRRCVLLDIHNDK